MKIRCTNEEKWAFLYAYEMRPEAPCVLARHEDGCAMRYKTCMECLEKNIEWQIEPLEEGEDKEC